MFKVAINPVSTRSQINQDINVINFFNGFKNLYFIDIGAFDGEHISNSFILEKEYNWKGICSEAQISSFSKLIKCRNVICTDYAVFSKNGKAIFNIVEDGNGVFSGLHTINGDYQIKNDNSQIENQNEIIVNTITLQDLLKKYNSPKIINYLSTINNK